MTDFSAFDFSTDFSVKEAAALIGGLDPLQTIEHGDFFLLKVEPIVQRLLDDFELRTDRAWETRRLSRDEVIAWLADKGLKSAYQFDLDQTTYVTANRGRWPWGSHHTEMLGHLEAAALRYWVNYDPAELGTASTNVTVIEWLQTERKVSKTMAEAIASMLRPDGLRTGPR